MQKSQSALTLPSLAKRLDNTELVRLGEILKDDSACEQYFGSSQRMRARGAHKMHQISQAIDNTAQWKEQLWSTTNGEYGALKPHGKYDGKFNLFTAKWFLADHPHWKNPVVADYKGLKSTYADLGQPVDPVFLNHNVTQEFLHM